MNAIRSKKVACEAKAVKKSLLHGQLVDPLIEGKIHLMQKALSFEDGFYQIIA
ncbi:MAG: hypothetical protein ABI416_01435 [Ginsengibacter sp.]